jgi:hypothetical protein
MLGTIGNASNLKTGTNPPFTLDDFYLIYPQFGKDSNANYVVPQIIVQMYLDLANSCINETRWHSYWKVGMSFFIAHFCTLYLQGTADPNSGAAGVLKAGQAQGLQSSVSVGDYMLGTIGNASNLKTGTNPPFTLDDFYLIYPQFGKDSNANYVVPQIIVQMYLDLANSCINETRWHSYWKVGMSFFIAHFCTLYLQGTANPESGAAGVLKAGQAQGLQSSVSVGDVSISTDYSIIASGIDGWAGWKLTSYGQQLASIGRLLGKGGMYVY